MMPVTAEPQNKVSLPRSAFIVSMVLLGAFALVANNASAASLRVKIACKNDYYAFCNGLGADSPETRQCMRVAGPKLSKRCIDALLAAGEVTPAEVAQRTPK